MTHPETFNAAGARLASVGGMNAGAAYTQQLETAHTFEMWGMTLAELAALAAVIYTCCQIFVLIPKMADVVRCFFRRRRERRCTHPPLVETVPAKEETADDILSEIEPPKVNNENYR